MNNIIKSLTSRLSTQTRDELHKNIKNGVLAGDCGCHTTARLHDALLEWSKDVDSLLYQLAHKGNDFQVKSKLDVPSRYMEHEDGIILDAETELRWSRETYGSMNWNEAIKYCAELRLADHVDWRLPTRKELLTVVDDTRHNPACDPVFGAQSNFYWSSSTYVYNPQLAWTVAFDGGFVNAYNKTLNFYVRAVRGGKP